MAQLKTRTLDCLFYSHAWSIYQLEKLGLIKTGNELVLELALESRLAPVFDQSEKRHQGLIPLLQPGTSLHKLAIRHNSVTSPVILAPNPSVAVDIQLSALALATSTESPIDKVITLIHVNDGPTFAGAYPMMSRFSIAWDVADYPNVELSNLTQSLVDQQCLSKEKWNGFFLGSHPDRQSPDNKLREAVLRSLLNEFPVLNAA